MGKKPGFQIGGVSYIKLVCGWAVQYVNEKHSIKNKVKK
jgi:hypothetical protein